MAGVAAGMAQEIILVLGLGFPEVARRHDLGYDLAGPEPGLVDIGDSVFGNPALLVSRVEDCRPVARADVIPFRWLPAVSRETAPAKDLRRRADPDRTYVAASW
jgi:hypothetical protein